jgi:hypothetical protein
VSAGGDKIAPRRKRAGGGLLPAVIASHEATTQARGISLDAFLRDYLIKNAPSLPPTRMSADEWEKALDECFDVFPAIGPLPDDAFSREDNSASTSAHCGRQRLWAALVHNGCRQ